MNSVILASYRVHLLSRRRIPRLRNRQSTGRRRAAAPLRRLNSIRSGEGMVYDSDSRESGTFIWQRQTSLVANADGSNRQKKRRSSRGSVNLRRRDLTFPSRSDHSPFFFTTLSPTSLLIRSLALFLHLRRILYRSDIIEFN